MKSAVLSVLLTAVLLATPAAATYSIAATHPASRQVGSAGTSCVGSFSVYVIYGASPGHGVVDAQAQVSTAGRDRAVTRLAADVAPANIIAEITAPAFDANAATRQYGIADLAGRTAGFTGASNGSYAGDRQGAVDGYAYSVQGNILTGVAVIDQAALGLAEPGCDLADRLMHALEAGARNGQGDSRCTPGGIPSDGAFIQVDREGEPAASYLRLRVDDTAPANPIAMLRQQFDAWRLTHPCPPGLGGGASSADGGATGGDGGDPETGGGSTGAGGCGCGAREGSTAMLVIGLAVFMRRCRSIGDMQKQNRASTGVTP